jgi:NADH-quinone oxidoreductase subunit D
MPIDTTPKPPELQTEEMILNMGPQHPSTHGVLRLEVTTDGEVVRNVRPFIGYLHRCFEKHAEKVGYTGVIPYTDRMDYLAAMNNNHGYVITVEKLLGLEIPERAEYIRVIIAELNRIASHLVAFGTFANDVGATTPLLYAFREREQILDIFEMACGARLTYNYYRIGGVSGDLTPEMLQKIAEFCDYFEPKLKDYDDLFSYNKIFIERAAGVGVIPLSMAVNYGITGPALRASGMKWDLRKNDPYSIYPKLDFDIPIGRGLKGELGDTWDRYMVRMWEMAECLKIIRQCLAQIPEGDYLSPKTPKLIKCPKGEVYCRVENPRGELGYYLVSDGKPNLWRLKVRSPCFTNLAVIDAISDGVMIADLVAILGSLDIVLGEIDR